MSRTSPIPLWWADLALAFIALIWGATFVLVKRALDDVSALLFLALRFTLATAALAIAFRGRYGTARAGHKLGFGMIAGLFLFLGYVFQTIGLRHTTASKSAFITGLSVAMVPLFASLVYKKAPAASEWVGIATATVGMALLTLPPGQLRIGLGDSLTAGCAVAFAVHIVAVGHYSPRIGVESLSLIQVATAALLGLATFWWEEAPRVKWTLEFMLALAVTALLATALAFTLQAWAQKHTTATHTALVFALEPVFAWLTSYLVAGETLTGPGVAGAALILGGILMVGLKPIRAATHPSG